VCGSRHPSSWRSTLAACNSTSALQDGLVSLGVCPSCCSSLPQWPLHTCHSHLRSTESQTCNDWKSAGYVCLDRSKVSMLMDRPLGTVCCPHYAPPPRLDTEQLQAGIKSVTVLNCPATLRLFCNSGARYK